jgi:hypothetical protein
MMKWIAGNLVNDAHECPQCEMLMKQNRELHDRLLAVYAPAAAQMTSQYELGRLQLQPVPPVPAVPPVSQPEPGVGA